MKNMFEAVISLNLSVGRRAKVDSRFLDEDPSVLKASHLY